MSLWKNYLMSMESLQSSLVNEGTLSAVVEMLKVLPTRDNEYFELADMLFALKQILSSHGRFLDLNFAGQESVSNSEEVLVRLMDALKFHLMPYLEETGVSGLENDFEADMSPKQYLVYRYLELLQEMVKVDVARTQRLPSSQRQLLLSADLSRSTFLTYLIDVFHVSKGNAVLKK